MFKKIIITLVLLGLALPAVAGAARERPMTRIEACTLKHDLSDMFGPDYAINKTIAANEEAAARLQPGLELSATIAVDSIAALEKAELKLKTETLLQIAARLSSACKTKVETLKGQLDASSGGQITPNMYKEIKESCDRTGIRTARNWVLNKLLSIAGVAGAAILPEAGVACLVDLMETISDWLFIILLVVAGIFILWGGYTFVIAGGAPEKLTRARNVLIWALVGVAVAFLSKGLVKLIEQIMTQ